jgi:pyruvate kinase
MEHHPKVPNLAKIVATLGPASAAESTMRDMVRSGISVARVNFSHGSADANLELIRQLRRVAEREERPVAVMQDLQGPRLRIGILPENGLLLREDSLVTLYTGVDQAEDDMIPVPERQLARAVRRGDRLLIHDGQLELEVVKADRRRVMARVLLGGVLKSNYGLTAPTARVHEESLTEKDKRDLALGLTEGVDFIAQSYVRTADDIANLRKLMKDLAPADTVPPAVIVKIETHDALTNLGEILEVADGVMVARGDLGLETSVSAVPVTQKEIVAKCVVAGKPVVVATQLLASMVTRPRPTRAEVSDVANAVLDRADALMLSDETAVGRHPTRSVAQMAEIIEQTEAGPIRGIMPELDSHGESVPQAVAAAAVQLARHADAVAILVVTRSGYSARAVARFRWEVPIFAASDTPQVVRQLSLSWGVTPLFVDGYERPEEMAHAALKQLRSRFGVAAGARVVVVSGLRRPKGGYDSTVRVVET